ncbi:MAG: hypothetical protein KOO60_01030 [Gemmatimonadales bacterium]|nr:hypothetical protein [Gemmatimonadales bacterium]
MKHRPRIPNSLRPALPGAMAGITVLLVVGFAIGTAVDSALGATGEDDGSRSILADGAGNRALALGGAYAAIADDASAVIWNPGGLGWLQRREFQASHTNLIGLGFNEQYASFVLPSWRWGVGSFTFRRFGVDGIEQRDSRNLLLADDLTYAETEFTLAYGRQLATAWALGGGLKLRRHCLGDFNDSGLGIDLGLMVKPGQAAGVGERWAENLTVGLSVRNAIEPSLRLDQEQVPDPTGIRIGSSYKHPLGKEGWVLGTLDVEKTRELNNHLHMGLEVCLVPALSLRTGLNRGTLVAGMGVQWQDIGIDYIFENLTDNPIHRFGVSFQFGPSRDEKQMAARTEAERDLQKRLASEFIRRNDERRIELLQRARAALELGRTDEAAELVAMIKVIDPENEQVLELEIGILRQEAQALADVDDFAGTIVVLSHLLELAPGDSKATLMLARIRNASDSRTARTEEIRSYLDQAMDNFAAGKLLDAKAGFDRVLALDPNDSEARSMVERTALVISGRVNDLLEHARVLGRAGNFPEAHEKLKTAQVLDPENHDLASTRTWLNRLEKEDRMPDPVETASEEPKIETTEPAVLLPVAPVGPPPVTQSQKREMAEMYERGMTAMQNGSADQAVHFWELVWSIDPAFQQVSEYLKQYYLTRGMEAFVAGKLQDAVRSWENAVRVSPDDSKARGYLQRAQDQIKRLEKMAG